MTYQKRTVINLLPSCLVAAGLAIGQSARADYLVTNAWKVLPGAAHIANANDNNRGIAAGTNKVYVSNKSTPAIDVFDGTQGTNNSTAVGSVNLTGLSGGTFVVSQLGVGSDEVLYAANLTTAANTTPFKLYRWDDVSQTAVTAFSGDLSGGVPVQGLRAGDSLTVRGGGTGTQILVPLVASTTASTNVVIFSTTDGTNFTPTVLAIPGLGTRSGVQPGLAFYTNNSFLYRPGGPEVYLVQFPANFASLSSPVTATVLSTNTFGTLSSGVVFFDVNPAAGLTATLGPINAAPTPVNLYGVPPLAGISTPLATTNSAHSVANGNGVGNAAFGGQGKTNYIYTLDANNGVYGFKVAFVPPQPPTIATAPIGATNIYPPYILTVGANGAQPLSYQWLSGATSNSLTPIGGATTNSYTVTGGGTNYYAVIVSNSVSSVTSAPVLVGLLTPVTNPSVTNLWRIAIGTSGFSYLANDNESRGLGYDTNKDAVLVATISGGTAIYIINGTYGTNAGSLSMSGLALSGTRQIDQVAASDDGQVYACNLALITSGDAFKLFRWPAATNTAIGTQLSAPTDPGSGSGDRWGDYMDLRGSGTGTQIILASKTTRVALLTTADGNAFTSTLITITNVPSGFAANGITFGSGNTFWAKSFLGHLYYIAYDPVSGTGGYVYDYSTFPSRCVGLGVDSTRNILGSINLLTSPNDLELFSLTGSADAPILFDQVFLASANANGNANGVVRMKYPRVYALEVNNGLVAASYGPPAATAPNITTPPANLTAYTNDPTAFFSVGVSGSLPLFYQWRFNGVNLTNGTNAILSLPNPQPAQQGNYDVVVHNLAGYATSAPAALTVIAPLISSTVTQAWRLAAGSRTYLDSASYQTRGISYDPASGIVVLADHFNLYFLAATNGSDLGSLTPAGLPNGGINAWTLDQVGVADDGVMYSCNLGQGGGFAIISYSTPVGPAMGPLNYAYGGSTGADPSGTGDRFGDTMDVRGSGTSTEIICGSQNGTIAVVFDTADGTTFSPHVINVTGAPAGFCGQGIAFGSGNTFWTKSIGFNLRQVSYDKNTGVGTIVQSFTAGTDIDSGLAGIDVDTARNVLAGVNFSDTPNDAKLYNLGATPPYGYDQEFFASRNANSQFNAATVLKSGFGASLDVNNGVVAFTYGTPPAAPTPAPQITSVSWHAGTGTSLTWTSVNTKNYQVQFRASLTTGNWANVGSPITATGTTTSYTDSTATGGIGFYRVVTQ